MGEVGCVRGKKYCQMKGVDKTIHFILYVVQSGQLFLEV